MKRMWRDMNGREGGDCCWLLPWEVVCNGVKRKKECPNWKGEVVVIACQTEAVRSLPGMTETCTY